MNKLPLALLLLATGLIPVPATALRPFDGTDADVAPAGVFELELGPLGLLREGSSRHLVTPAAVANIGLGAFNELVLEGRAVHRLDGGDGRRTQFEDAAISVKRVLRQGALQDGGSGASIAMECSLLLPGSDEATGAGCAGIVSQRLSHATLHWNAALARTRDRKVQRALGLIVVGGHEGDTWQPVAEALLTRAAGHASTRSMLLGLVARRSASLALDVGVRKAIGGDGRTMELRAGLTWMTQH